MKKDQKIALRAMEGFARYGVTEVRFGNKVARLKGKKVVVEKVKKDSKPKPAVSARGSASR